VCVCVEERSPAGEVDLAHVSEVGACVWRRDEHGLFDGSSWISWPHIPY